MGDTGSLALGGALGTVAVLLKREFLLVVIGGIFVLEALSVILPGSLLQASEEADLEDGPAAPPFRIVRVGGDEGGGAVLDRGGAVCASVFVHP
jgi:hypothetical protein